ncbi:MAG: DegT/DnrJ/EryC1/StrS family aminotransferase [bacterium]|nr:DegT/DnrJ/EryC1/StrS family aminotransferase [bacterium]
MKTIALNDFRAQWHRHRDAIQRAVASVGESGWLVLGSQVQGFEQALASRWGLPFAIGCASGLDAIELALRAGGIATGDRVLTTPLSAFATTLAITRAGGVPVFVDVDACGQLDLDQSADALDRGHADGAPIRFMVPVHLYGHAMDLTRLAELRDRHGLCIVEDCAQAIGARHRGLPVGHVGQFAATSFYPTKNLGAYGDAGAVLCQSQQHDTTLRSLRDYGQTGKFEHDLLGLNSRLDELQAAILLGALLPDLDRATARRKEIAGRYLGEIRNPLLSIPPVPEHSESVWHLFPVLAAAAEPDRENSRAAFREHLEANAIASGVHYPRLISQQKALAAFDTSASQNRALEFAQCEVSLPIHPYLEDEDVERVVSACNTWTR